MKICRQLDGNLATVPLLRSVKYKNWILKLYFPGDNHQWFSSSCHYCNRWPAVVFYIIFTTYPCSFPESQRSYPTINISSTPKALNLPNHDWRRWNVTWPHPGIIFNRGSYGDPKNNLKLESSLPVGKSSSQFPSSGSPHKRVRATL